MEDAGIQISLSNRKFLLELSRETITNHLKKIHLPEYLPAKLSPEITIESGTFVSLHKHGELRGCIGRFVSEDPLYLLVQEMAIASAFRDPRFDPVVKEELKDIEIEISVLSPLRKITSINEFDIFQHGIYIKKGNKSGTFLPQVAMKTQWTKEQLLGHCSRDKAGLGWNGWKNAELFIYSTLIFNEKDINGKEYCK